MCVIAILLDALAVPAPAGSLARQEAALIACPKFAGTEYIGHFCGTAVLTRVDADTTEVAQSEEAHLTSRSQDDMKRGLTHMLETLGELP